MRILLLLSIVMAAACCPIKSVSLAPSITYDAVKPTSVSAAGTVKVEFAEYCPSKTERKIIDDLRILSFQQLNRYIIDDIAEDSYNKKQKAIQGAVEHIVSQGRGLAQQKPVIEKVAKAVVATPADIVTGVTKKVGDTIATTQATKSEKVVVPPADPSATNQKKQEAVSRAQTIAN